MRAQTLQKHGSQCVGRVESCEREALAADPTGTGSHLQLQRPPGDEMVPKRKQQRHLQRPGEPPSDHTRTEPHSQDALLDTV